MDMRPTEIKIALIQRGVSQAEIARKLGVAKSSVNQVIDGRAVSHRIRTAVAEAIGIDIARIWPGTYLTGGPRKPGRPFCGQGQK
jgi:lambda repressor-like predicted transcriptional regulator